MILEGQEAKKKWLYEGTLVLNGDSWNPKDQDTEIMFRRGNVLCARSFLKGGNIAKNLAEMLHFGQYRKYHIPLQDYIVHPIRVAEKTIKFLKGTDFQYFQELIQAAYLHDVLEDCGVGIDLIKSNFGDITASFVDDLTNKFKDATDKNGKLFPRAMRKQLEFERIKTIQTPSKWIKMIDRLDNLSDMSYSQCGDFLNVYLGESEKLLSVVGDSDKSLKAELETLIESIRSQRK